MHELESWASAQALSSVTLAASRFGGAYVVFNMRLIVVSGFAALLTVAGAELATRVFVAFNPDPPGREQMARSSHPAYATAPYFSDKFVEEAMDQEPMEVEDAPGGLVLRDYSGEFINVRHGRRRTVGQPRRADRTVHVFGGSTVFGGEVPDAWTIPSQLQAALNEHEVDEFRVVNYGVPGFTVSDQVSLLKTVTLEPCHFPRA